MTIHFTLARALGRHFYHEPHLTGAVEVSGIPLVVGLHTDTNVLTFTPARPFYDERWSGDVAEIQLSRSTDALFGEWKLGATRYTIRITVQGEGRGRYMLATLEPVKYRAPAAVGIAPAAAG